jgi:polyhydroxyalkanoate synthase
MEVGSAAADAFVTVEDWANEGAPLTWAAGRDLFENFYAANVTETGGWRVAGKPLTLSDIDVPNFSIRSAKDKIVPAAASPVFQHNLELDLGHVGMIVSNQAPARMWAPLSDWLSTQDRNC